MTDFRALCAELLTELQTLRRAVADETGYPSPEPSAITRARAALAQPEPEEPTDKELHQLWQELYSFHDGPTSGEVAEIARAVLDRWGAH
jgi:hypothetical protein